MSLFREILERIDAGGPLQEAEEVLEGALLQARDLDGLKDLLRAGSLLLHAGAFRGELFLPHLGRALETMEKLRGVEAETMVVGLGGMGRVTLSALAARSPTGNRPQGFYLDVSTSRVQDLGPGVIPVILAETGAWDSASNLRYGDQLRATYRAAAGSNRPPAVLAEGLTVASAATLTIHVVVGLEEAWISVLPDLLVDLRSLLGRRDRGRVLVHFLTRPCPRLWPGYRPVLEDLERSRPFDDAFLVCSHEDVLAQRVVEFILLSSEAPEILLHDGAGERGGAYCSYGIAPLPAMAETGSSGEQILQRFERAYTGASPHWIPGNSVLGELASEKVFYIHPPASPPQASLWKLCQDLVPVALAGIVPTLCRIQRGLRLRDLQLT